ncbi:MAG TPA: hypothetical protein VE046_10765 [Steroidobacteraceae bacterium]|nr:hypothetical protein [Steroidobacteraceae bacterium]
MAGKALENSQLSEGLFVINLDSSSLPMALLVPFRHELEGFSVFRSRKIEEGRERFRLHVGYFDTQKHAEEALEVVRKYFVGAWISSAPGENLGSLEDTVTAEFRLVRTAYARVVKPKDAHRHAEFPAPQSLSPSPVTSKIVASAVVREPTIEEPELDGTPTKPEKQRYAAQLEWAVAPIIAADIPRLAIFDAYSLYTVREQREGVPQYGLRLGFFSSADSARQVAEYVRAEFPNVSVIPVSHREYTRALEAARARALKAVESGELKISAKTEPALAARPRP